MTRPLNIPSHGVFMALWGKKNISNGPCTAFFVREESNPTPTPPLCTLPELQPSFLRMSRSNTLGSGLQTELTSVRLHMARGAQQAQMRATTSVPSPVAPLPQRKVLAFKPTLPGVSKPKPRPPPSSGRTRLVLKVKIKSPALQRRLGMA